METERLYSPEEYLALERASPYKHELFDGRLVPRTGPDCVEWSIPGNARAHSLITGNARCALMEQLRRSPAEVYGDDLGLMAGARSWFYPDVAVACGEIRFDGEHPDTLLNPVLIIEVASPATEVQDRGTKWGAYQRLPSLQHYVLIAQDRASVELYTRQGDHWLFSSYTHLDDVVDLSAIDCRLRVGDLYHKVELAPSEVEQA